MWRVHWNGSLDPHLHKGDFPSFGLFSFCTIGPLSPRLSSLFISFRVFFTPSFSDPTSTRGPLYPLVLANVLQSTRYSPKKSFFGYLNGDVDFYSVSSTPIFSLRLTFNYSLFKYLFICILICFVYTLGLFFNMFFLQ